ncbi:MAG TPA: MraY family glycosyltransferase [Spongiibacteraceae bacterium]|nr:MraY family glycosyltransferase [Spongiibacteraceae bacterium]
MSGMELIYSFTVALFLTIALIPVMIRISPRLGLIDIPDARKVHSGAIPRSGGIAMAVGILAPLVILLPLQGFVPHLLAATLLIVVFGALDDRNNLSYRWKFLGQILAVLLVMKGGVIAGRLPFMGLDAAPAWLSYGVTFFFILGVTNAVNLTDGLDGLAAGTALLALALILVLCLQCDSGVAATVAATTLGGVLGFLRYNTFPARIFMGDTGSQMLGFLCAVLALIVTQDPQSPVSPLLPVLILGLPILDTLMVMGIRLAQRRSPFSPDKNHLHHQLIGAGLYHYEAVALIYMIQISLGVIAYLGRFESDALLLAIYLGFCAALLLPLWLIRRSGFRFRAIPHAGEERRNSLLRRMDWYYYRAPQLIELMLAAVFCFVGAMLLARGEAMPSGWVWVPVLVVIISGALFLWLPAWSARVACYLAGSLLVYAASIIDMPGWAGHLLNGWLVALVLCLMLAIRMTRREQFRLDTQDLLVLAMLLIVPQLPFPLLDQYDIGKIALRLAVIMYCCEFLIARRGTRRLVALNLASVFGALALAFNQF